MRIKPGLDLTAEEDEEVFNNLYKEHGVETVGEWVNSDDDREVYFITGYRDEEHYNSFVSAMKENSAYIESSKKLGDMRESVKAVNLNSMRD